MAVKSVVESGGQRRSRVLRTLLMSGLATALLATFAEPADAWSLFGDPAASQTPQRKRATARRWRQPETQQQKTATPAQPEKKLQGPFMIVVSIKTQKVWLYAGGELASQSIVSTGTPGHDTPVGVFAVIEKDRHHRSNIYSNAPMPYMQRITWSGVALHQGFVTGRPASHGCIRLQQPFAEKLWGLTELGARVIVSPEDVTPHAFSHEKLFVAKAKPAPVAVLQPDPVPTAKIRLATNAERTDVPTVPVLDLVSEDDPLANGPAVTDMIRAEAAKDAAPAATAEPATGSVPELPKETVAEPTKAEEPVKAAEPAKEAAPVKQVASAPAATEDEVAKPRELEKQKPRATGKELPLKPGPITVFVSRQTGKLYVRKGFWPVFEAPVKIAEPGKPFGTHVFTALEAKGTEGAMRWNVVSMSNVATRDRRSPQHKEMLSGNPADVLNRITIPDEALDRISELMTPGASFIVSDLGVSPETTPRGTDIIVQVR